MDYDSPEPEDEMYDSQELEDEMDDFEILEDEMEDAMDDSQKLEDKMDDSPESEDEMYDSQELEDEMDDFEILEDEMDESQKLEDKMDNSQFHSPELEDEMDDSPEPEDEMDDSQKTAVVVDEWVMEIEGRLEKRSPIDSNIEKKSSIFGKWQSWDDFGASYIPETQKWILVACMRHYFGLNVRSYLVYMQQKVDLAWSYYQGVHDKFRTAKNTKRFIELLLVKSCFVIFSIILFSGKKGPIRKRWFEIIKKGYPKGLSKKALRTIIDFILLEPLQTKGYLMTMEYQIPWFVVQAVYTKLSNLSTLFETPINNIGYIFCSGFNPRSLKKIVDDGTVPEGGFKHLLHIFHWSRTTHGKYLVNSKSANNWIGRIHIPSATELKLSQTVFIKDTVGSIDVSYADGRISGAMRLTPWHLSNYNTKLYENLLKFESFNYGEKPFTTYVACMACFIKEEADVKVLRESGVIARTTFHNKDVLLCVQKLKTFIPDNLKSPNELIKLQKEVMARYKKSAYKLYGDFKNRFCSNPWITISVIGGFFIFVLTFIQTVLSFIQTKYSVLSYKKQ